MHTKGEWTAYKDPNTVDTYLVDVKHVPNEKEYKEIAVVFHKDDARLIAASPRMFDLLKQLLKVEFDTDADNYEEVAQIIESAQEIIQQLDK